MAVNHRCSARIPLRVEVDVFHQGRDLGHHVTRNLDPEGAFIETGPIELHPNDVVELELAVTDTTHLLDHVHALVIWRNGDGIGVMFMESNPAFYEQLGRQLPEWVEFETLQVATRRHSDGT